jgi:hypothetical protein
MIKDLEITNLEIVPIHTEEWLYDGDDYVVIED